MALSLALMKNLISMMLMVIIGYVIVKIKFLKSRDAQPLSMLTAYVLTPCLILEAFQRDITAEQMKGFFVAMIAATLRGLLFIVLAALRRPPCKLDAVDQATLIYMNCGNLLLPLISMTLGDDMVFYCVAFQVPFNLLCWSHGQAIIRGKGSLRPAQMFLNPNVLALGAALLLMALGIRFPSVLATTVTSLGNMVGPASMIVIGMSIAESDLGAVLRSRRTWLINFGRLIAFPFIAMLILYATGFLRVHPEFKDALMVTMMCAAAPPAATVTQIAVACGNEPFRASFYNVLGTLLCVATLPVMIYLFQVMFA